MVVLGDIRSELQDIHELLGGDDAEEETEEDA
jgi:hypothetical protein